MTTTHDVPMPEPLCYGRDPRGFCVGYTADQLRAYADARCAKLQEESQEWRALAIAIADDLNDERIAHRALAEKVKALQDDALRYRHYRNNSTILLCVRADRYGGLNNVRIEGRFLDELTDAAIDAAMGE